jgi:hypothetical protein
MTALVENCCNAMPARMSPLRFQPLESRDSGVGQLRSRLICAHLGHRAIAIPDLEAAIRALRLNRRKKIAGRWRYLETPFVVSMPGR